MHDTHFQQGGKGLIPIRNPLPRGKKVLVGTTEKAIFNIMSGTDQWHGIGEGERMLLDRLSEGDISAFDSIYAKYFHAVYRNALMLTKNVSEAEDVVQEVFLRLWRSRESLAGRDSAGGWLFLTCHNHCVNILKRRMRKPFVLRQMEPTGEQYTADEQDGRLALLERGISELPTRQRQAFVLCKIEGFSQRETADMLSISRHTVKEYISHAMASVRRFAKENAGRTTLWHVILPAWWVGL